MRKLLISCLIGIVGLAASFGCQSPSPEPGSAGPAASESDERQATESEAVILEETFEGGETGALTAEESDSAATEEESPASPPQ